MMLVISTNNVQCVNMKMQDTNSASSPEIPHPGMRTHHSATFSGDSMLLVCIAYHSASSLEISCSWNCTAYHPASSLEILCSWNCTAYHSASSLEISCSWNCTAYHSASSLEIFRSQSAHLSLKIPRSHNPYPTILHVV